MHRKVQYRPRIRLNARRRLHRLVSHAEASMPRLPPPAGRPCGVASDGWGSESRSGSGAFGVRDRGGRTAGDARRGSGPHERLRSLAEASSRVRGGFGAGRAERFLREAPPAPRGDGRQGGCGRSGRPSRERSGRPLGGGPTVSGGFGLAKPSRTGKAFRHGRPASRVAGNGRPRAPASAARRRGVSAQGTLAATGGLFDDGAEACAEPWPAPGGVRSAASVARCVGFPGPAHLTPLLLPARGRQINNILWLMAPRALNVGPQPH